jgi:hypothetical protein
MRFDAFTAPWSISKKKRGVAYDEGCLSAYEIRGLLIRILYDKVWLSTVSSPEVKRMLRLASSEGGSRRGWVAVCRILICAYGRWSLRRVLIVRIKGLKLRFLVVRSLRRILIVRLKGLELRVSCYKDGHVSQTS